MQTTRFVTRSDTIVERVADFMAHLRGNGVPAGFLETEAAMRALGTMDATDVNCTRVVLKAICTRNQDDFDRFDDLFKAFWLNRGLSKEGTTDADTLPKNKHQHSNRSLVNDGAPSRSSGTPSQADTGEEGEASGGGQGRLIASRSANLATVDFRELMTPESLDEAERAATMIARSIRDRRSRRKRAHRKGAVLDLRRVARSAVQTGGEPLKLFKRRTPDRPVTLVALLDVSGSMTVYARVFLAFLKGLMSADQKTQAFLFHTKLVNIGEALRDHDMLRAVNRLSMMAQGFGGGTRIAGNLETFNTQYARRTVDGRSVVIILSDGYDTDRPELMSQQMARLKRRGCRIIWLNPLKGWSSYEPVARGMAAALPYVDFFAAANTLESLEAIAPELDRL